MRADFYGRASQYPTLAQTLTVHQLLVAPMTPRELREAVLLPAEEVGLEMEKELALALVQDTINEPGALPLLQHALLELFNRRSEDDVLTIAAYQDIGGVRGALAHRADDVLNHLTPEQQELARNIFLRLTTLGEGVSDTRRRVNRQELYPVGTDPTTIDTVLQALSGQEARLVVADEESVEVTHEALIQQWGQLRNWLEENRDNLRIHRRVTEAAKEWQANKRDGSYLFRGARLAEAEAWQEDNQSSLTEIEQVFLETSSAETQHELEEARKIAANLRRRALIAGGVGVVAVIAAIVATIYFFNAKNAELKAVRQARIAQSQNLAITAEQLKDDNLRALLVREAYTMTLGHEPQLFSLLDSTLRTIRNETFLLSVLSSPRDEVGTLAFSSNNQWLAAGSDDNNVYLWPMTELENGPRRLDAPESSVRTLAFSSNNQWLAAGSDDNNVYLWSMTELENGPRRLDAPESLVRTLAFSSDNQWLAAGSDDSNVYLWSLAAPEITLRILDTPEDEVGTVVISSDNQWLAAGSANNVYLWSLVEPGFTPHILNTPSPWFVRTLAFSSGNQWLAAGSYYDGNVYLWSLVQPEPVLQRLASQPRLSDDLAALPISTLAFSFDNQWLATGSLVDANVYLWSLAEPEVAPRILEDPLVTALAFSPDNHWLATGSRENVHLWSLAEPEAEPRFLDAPADVALAFSSDSQWLATGSDSNVYLWSLIQPEAEPHILDTPEREIRTLAFSSDSQWLAAGSNDSNVYLWSLVEPEAEPRILDAPADVVSVLAFSSDSQWLAAGSNDSNVYLFEVSLENAAVAMCQLASRNLTLEEWRKYMPADMEYRATCPNLPRAVPPYLHQ